MHHFKAKNGTKFNFNSDMSGEVYVSSPCSGGESAEIPGDDILEFVNYLNKEYDMDKKDDFAMMDFTADKARKISEAAIPELVNAKMGAILTQIRSQSDRGEFALRVPVNDISQMSLNEVRDKLCEMGYKVHMFLAPGSIDISWYPPDSGD